MVKGKIPCRMGDLQQVLSLVGGCVTQDRSHKAFLAVENQEQSMLGSLGKNKLNDLIPAMDAQMP